MREIKFRVRDSESKKILGYEVFNSILNDGYYFIDLSELKDGADIGDLILHTNYSELPMIRPLTPLGSLIREQYSGHEDKNGVEIYENDILHMGDKKILYVIEWNDTGLEARQVKNKSYAGIEYHKKWIEVFSDIYENKELLG